MFEEGDWVRCRVHDYVGTAYNQVKQVLAIHDNVITLKNRCSPYGTSDYLAHNFSFVRKGKIKEIEKDEPMAAYEKTKYFGMKVIPNTGIVTIDDLHQTGLFDHKSEAINKIKEYITEGEQWLVLQTIAMVQFEEPKPPIIVTEYK